MTLYRDYQSALHPTALAGPYGLAWGRSQGTMKDRVITLAVDAVDAGLVLRCTDDALPLLGADVALPRYSVESTTTHRARILGAWDTWVWAGTSTALLTVAAQIGLVGVVLRTAREWGLPDAATFWARWWMLVPPQTSIPVASDGLWDDAGTYDDGGTWDSDASLALITDLRAAFRRFSNARDRGFVRLSLDPATDYYDDGGKWDGTGPDVWNDDPAFLELEI